MTETKEKWSFREWIMPLLNINFFLLILIETANSLTNEMIKAPASPFANALGLSSFVIGVCASLYTASMICARPFSGYGMDKMNKRNIIIGAFVLKAVVAILYGCTGNVYMYAISRCAHGFVFAMLGSALPAAITAAVDKKSMGTALGIFAAAPQLLGAAWGTKFSQMLYGGYGFRTAYFAIAAVMIAPVILTLFVKFDENREIKIRKKRSFNIFSGISLRALPLCVMTFFIMVGYYANSLYRIVFMESRGVDIGTAVAIAGMLSVITKLMGGVIADRFGAKWVVAPSFAMCAAAEFLLPVCMNFQICVISCILWSLGIGMYLPALQSQVFNAVPSNERGAASATWYMCADLTGLISSPILGMVCDWAGYSVCFIFAGGCILTGLVYYLTFGQKLLRRALERNLQEAA